MKTRWAMEKWRGLWRGRVQGSGAGTTRTSTLNGARILLGPIWMFNVALPLRRVAAPLPSTCKSTRIGPDGRCYARDVTEWGLTNIGPCERTLRSVSRDWKLETPTHSNHAEDGNEEAKFIPRLGARPSLAMRRPRPLEAVFFSFPFLFFRHAFPRRQPTARPI